MKFEAARGDKPKVDVLPLTREWIEIVTLNWLMLRIRFSLLRGSGLKFNDVTMFNVETEFSLLRGSGLKFPSSPIVYLESMFSLLRGSGLKFRMTYNLDKFGDVLPLTREWIEMAESGTNAGSVKFSLLRGSGLKSKP